MTLSLEQEAGVAQQDRFPIPEKRRSLLAACLAHMLHDGYTDLLYILLLVWRSEFGLSYAGLAVLRALYSGTMGGLQVPANHLTSRFSARTILVVATFSAALGYLVTAAPGGYLTLCIGLVIAGIGSSLQHPRGSLMVTESYGSSAREPLGIYNFAGDLGKSVFPPAVALLLSFLAWRSVSVLVAGMGLLTALVLWVLVPRGLTSTFHKKPDAISTSKSGTGFRWLLVIGALDTAPRMGYLLFLPFLLHDKGGVATTTGIGLALVFIGGALGKAACGWLGHRLGVTLSVVVTETATGLLILATLVLPLAPTLTLLPVLGVVLNGTSSVLYGTVPELTPRGDTGKAFAWFYTAVLGSGAVAPIAYGALADHFNRTIGVTASALTALMVVPLVLGLRPHLSCRGMSGVN